MICVAATRSTERILTNLLSLKQGLKLSKSLIAKKKISLSKIPFLGLAHQMAKCRVRMKQELRNIYKQMSRDYSMGGKDLLIVKLSLNAKNGKSLDNYHSLEVSSRTKIGWNRMFAKSWQNSTVSFSCSNITIISHHSVCTCIILLQIQWEESLLWVKQGLDESPKLLKSWGKSSKSKFLSESSSNTKGQTHTFINELLILSKICIWSPSVESSYCFRNRTLT